MAQTTMYPITTSGLQTVLTQALSTSDTQLYVQDITVFDNASNIVTIKTNSTSWEVCKYTGKTAVSGNEGYLTIVRSGTEHLSSATGNAAVAFNPGAKAFRGLTNYDYAALRGNITDHETRLTAAEGTISGIDTRLTAAESAIDVLEADVEVFGFLWNTVGSSPTLINCDQNGDTLLLNGTNFDHHPLWGNIKRCQLTAAGVATYGSDNKGTGLTTTSDYMMVEIPQAHVIQWTDGDYRGFALSNEAFTGKPGSGSELSSSVHPWFNQRGGSSAAPCAKGYVGAYKASANGTTSLSSKSGVAPLANIDMATFEARGNAIGSNWGITNIHYQSLLQLLMYTEFANMNLQSALAPGFTKSTNTAPQTCGANDALMGTNGTGGGTDVQGVNYRGINNPYGDIWEFRIGWNSVDAEYRVLKADGTGTIAATLASGSYDATSGITPLNGTTNISGTDAGNYCHGYVKSILNIDPLKLFFIPSILTGSETTYLCDYFYSHSVGQTGCLLAGGHLNYAGSAGPGSLNAFNAVSGVGSDIGARVEFLGATS